MINTKDIVILAVYGYILFYVLKPIKLWKSVWQQLLHSFY